VCFVCRQGCHEIQPADVVLFEGILAFYFAPLRELFDVRLFVDLDADTRLAMRGTARQCALFRLEWLVEVTGFILGG